LFGINADIGNAIAIIATRIGIIGVTGGTIAIVVGIAIIAVRGTGVRAVV
jgi:hypothetical protein